MARRIKSIQVPEIGHPHREHRSKKGRTKRPFGYKDIKEYKQRKEEV